MSHEILVVEDSPTQAESLCMLLEQRGFAVTVARSAEEATALLRAREFALVLTDVVMPGEDGYALTRHVKQEQPELPVILLTTLGDPLDIVRGLAAGADNYVTKPYDEDVLLGRVEQALSARGRRRPVKASLGMQVEFLGTHFTITSEKEQILDLLLSSIEDTVRTNRALQESQRRLAEAHEKLQEHADAMRQQALASTGRYRTLMQHVWASIFVLDGTGRILETNERAERQLADLAWLPSVAGSRPLTSLVAPNERARVEAALARLPAVRNTVVRDLPLGDAARPTAYWDLSLAMAPGDGADLVLAVAHDITERRLSERRLQESEERARTILDSLAEGVLLVNRDGEVQWSNRSAAAFLGLPPGEVLGPAAELRIDIVDEENTPLPADQYPSAVALREGRSASQMLGIRLPDRPMRWVLASAQSLTSDTSAPYATVTSLMDVTERKRVTEQLLQSQRLEAVGRLAGGVAHDFNNILTVIRSYCDVILAGLDSPSQLRDDMEEISNAADRAAILTRQLLAFGRRRMNFPQPLSLNDAITGVAPMLRRLVRADTELSLALAPMESSVVADAGQLEQVIMNLVVNARDAMPDGGRIVIESRAVRLDDANVDSVSPGALKPGLYALLSVSDTGIGMPPEIRDRIFEPFFTTKEQGKGTGLGLATVHGIVTDAGGDVAVYSEPGVGTTFKVYLPLTDEPACSPTGPATAPMCSGSGETILVAEDEEAVRRVVVHELRRLGYHVLEARTGDEALSVASRCQGPIHLLVTDMIMPGLNGRELAAAARRAHPGLRVLYTSGYSAEILSREDVREPGFAFLEKPFSIGELAREVRAALDGGAAPADRETCSSP